jgi:hypothetical protein
MVSTYSCDSGGDSNLKKDGEEFVRKIRKRIAGSRPRDPLRFFGIHWRMVAGAIVTMSVMLSFAWVGEFPLR